MTYSIESIVKFVAGYLAAIAFYKCQKRHHRSNALTLFKNIHSEVQKMSLKPKNLEVVITSLNSSFENFRNQIFQAGDANLTKSFIEYENEFNKQKSRYQSKNLGLGGVNIDELNRIFNKIEAS